MHDFIFHNPTKIIFGPGRDVEIGRELQSAGIGSVLLVYGCGSVRHSGLLDRIIKSLNEGGIGFVEHGGVISNPILSHTRAGIDRARKSGVEAVLAVGGGSVMDEAKAIAIGAAADCDVWEFFLRRREVPAALPVFTIPTLAASGSEMNGNAVITNEESQQKYNIATIHAFPRVSILNPELTHSVTPEYSAYGAVDAISHLIEAYFTKQPGTRLQDRLVEGLILTIMENAAIIRDEPDNAQARSSMMWASTLALNGLTPAGVGPYTFPNHMIEHSLSALYNIPHGAGLAIVMPAWMRWYQPRNPEQFQRFAREIFGLSSGEEGIAALKNWFKALGCPVSLGEIHISADDIPHIRDNVFDTARVWQVDQLYPPEALTEILQQAV